MLSFENTTFWVIVCLVFILGINQFEQEHKFKIIFSFLVLAVIISLITQLSL